jgi:hypothetical protein
LNRAKPIPRDAAQVMLTQMVLKENLENASEVIHYLIHRFMRVPPGDRPRQQLVAFLSEELGTTDTSVSKTYLGDPLRLVLHLIMSQPEYQLG